MTTNQTLRAHIEEMHGRRPPAGTQQDLVNWHVAQHLRHWTSHFHQGINAAGLRTGLDAVQTAPNPRSRKAARALASTRPQSRRRSS